MTEFNNFEEFFDWFKYNVAIELKLALGHDWRKNEDYETGIEYIEIFMDYDFEKVKNLLKNIKNIHYDKDRNYKIYFRKNKC